MPSLGLYWGCLGTEETICCCFGETTCWGIMLVWEMACWGRLSFILVFICLIVLDITVWMREVVISVLLLPICALWLLRICCYLIITLCTFWSKNCCCVRVVAHAAWERHQTVGSSFDVSTGLAWGTFFSVSAEVMNLVRSDLRISIASPCTPWPALTITGWPGLKLAIINRTLVGQTFLWLGGGFW